MTTNNLDAWRLTYARTLTIQYLVHNTLVNKFSGPGFPRNCWGILDSAQNCMLPGCMFVGSCVRYEHVFEEVEQVTRVHWFVCKEQTNFCKQYMNWHTIFWVTTIYTAYEWDAHWHPLMEWLFLWHAKRTSFYGTFPKLQHCKQQKPQWCRRSLAKALLGLSLVFYTESWVGVAVPCTAFHNNLVNCERWAGTLESVTFWEKKKKLVWRCQATRGQCGQKKFRQAETWGQEMR